MIAPGHLRGAAFFGGGSGGHLFPGIAVAEKLRERFPAARIVFFTSGRDVEQRIFATGGFDVRSLELLPPGRRPTNWVRYSFEVADAVRRHRKLLARDFDVVFGLGGYASVPGILAAKALHLPVILLEQNLVAGRVNRWLGRFADAVSCPYPDVSLGAGMRRAVTGNPVRRTVVEAGMRRRCRRSAMDDPLTVLVVGGSQGARSLNSAIARLLELAPAATPWRERLRWIHVTGEADFDELNRAYVQGGWRAQVLRFAQRLPDLMADADVVVTRAGGTTLSELAVVGVPALLVPYPHHRDQHQLRNAEAFAAAGAGVVIEDEELDGERLHDELEQLIASPARLASMSAAARRLARPMAADRVVDLALELRRSCPTASVSFS